jgi:hypothetical protein
VQWEYYRPYYRLQGAGSVSYYPKVLKGVLFLDSRSWALRVLGALDSLLLAFLLLGIAGTGSPGSPGSPRQSRQSSAAARPPAVSPCLRVMAGCFKGVSWEGLCRGSVHSVQWVRIYF